MSEAKELIAQADLLLADAVELIEDTVRPMTRRQSRFSRTLAAVAEALYFAAIVRQDQPVPDEEPSPSETEPTRTWFARLLRDHDCHVLIPQQAGGAAGNKRAFVRCQTCDAEIPLP